MEPEQESERTGRVLNVVGILACVAAILTTGPATVLAGTIAAACLIGSFVTSLHSREVAFDGFDCVCDPSIDIDISQEVRSARRPKRHRAGRPITGGRRSPPAGGQAGHASCPRMGCDSVFDAGSGISHD